MPPHSLLITLISLLSLSGTALAGWPPVTCHVTYGGETRHLRLTPAATPYTVKPQQIGSYFLWRGFVQVPPAELPAVRISIAANLDEGAVPIHIAEYPHPQRRGSKAPGFTGLQTVYEPVRDGELQYWCARGDRR